MTCMPQAACVCGMWQNGKGAENTATDRTGSKQQSNISGWGWVSEWHLERVQGLPFWHVCQKGWPPLAYYINAYFKAYKKVYF